ncbi:tRNA lysidine(34) synthetase TilS [Acidimicrobiia bacterium]|nr:tRNA lysidine(34) synthetase TilS [Acidimicrobiia bacterium]MDB0016880.1 tRNA lysidine(34) synthetase TilS [Acidimicrobiia bacterium]MDC0606432.1 tRNA lysidine(34) synthetase TilS [Acidimicrobiia bacterium]MDC3275278.1 tRNA lysidine(34) synthetase TilS [bacterium]MDC3373729.1 tRNA lysidine(34) synthetase TilS [Acidimicrobiia bacterium]
MSNPIEEKFLSNFDINKKYVVALSGGVDSAVLAFLATKYSKNVRSIFVNHNQNHSTDLELQAKYIANQLGIAFVSLQTSLEPNASETQMRNVRMKVLKMNIEEEEYLLFGHTLSDRVETFFMNLFRGTRLQGLKSTPVKVNKIIRPLLTVSKQEVITYAKKNKINYLDDETNFDNQINRNWIRNVIFDEVKERFTGSLEDKINQIISEVEYALPAETRFIKFIKSSKGYVEIPISMINFNNPELISSFSTISKLLGMSGMESKDIDKIKEVIASGNQVSFYGNWFCLKSSSLLIFVNKHLWSEQSNQDKLSYGYLNLEKVEKVTSHNKWNLAIPLRSKNISTRTLENGDKIRVNGTHQKVTEVIRSFGIKGIMKEVWPMMILDDEIIWLPGIRKSDAALDFHKENYSHIISASVEKGKIENF